MAGKFKVNKLYYFHYNPLLKDRLPFYDRRPLMFPLRMVGNKTLGLNIHWMPQKIRLKFLDHLTKESRKINNQRKFARMVYNQIKGTPFAQGIRLYINTRATNVIEISRKDLLSMGSGSLLQKHRSRKVFRH